MLIAIEILIPLLAGVAVSLYLSGVLRSVMGWSIAKSIPKAGK